MCVCVLLLLWVLTAVGAGCKNCRLSFPLQLRHRLASPFHSPATSENFSVCVCVCVCVCVLIQQLCSVCSTNWPDFTTVIMFAKAGGHPPPFYSPRPSTFVTEVIRNAYRLLGTYLCVTVTLPSLIDFPS